MSGGTPDFMYVNLLSYPGSAVLQLYYYPQKENRSVQQMLLSTQPRYKTCIKLWRCSEVLSIFGRVGDTSTFFYLLWDVPQTTHLMIERLENSGNYSLEHIYFYSE